MSLIPSTHSRFAWFQTGLFGGAGRGGPGRLVAIGGVLACMVGGAFLLSVRHGNGPPVSQVTKMKPGNLLPGGLQGTPAQDALQKEDLQEKAKAAEAAHKSYTPPIPSSTALQRRAAHRSRDGGSRGAGCPCGETHASGPGDRHTGGADLHPSRARRVRPSPLARTRSAGRASRKSRPGTSRATKPRRREKARASSGRRRSAISSTAGAPGRRRRRW